MVDYPTVRAWLLMLYELLLRRRDDAWVLIDPRWRQSVAGTLLCTTCGQLLPAVFPQEFEVPLVHLPPRRSAGIIGGPKLSLLRNDLAETLRPLMPLFAWCSLRNVKTNQPVTTHVACYTQQRVIVRGDKSSIWEGTCSECSRPRYGKRGLPYVMISSLNESQIYQGSVGELLVTEPVMRMIDWNRYQDIEPFCMPVVDHAIDGYDVVDQSRQ